MLVDVTYTETGMDVSYVHDKKFHIEHFNVSQYPNSFPVWEVCNPEDALPDWHNWDGKPVRLKYARRFNMFDRLQFLSQLPEDHFNRLHNYSEIPILAVDFETEIRDGFPEAEDIYDKNGNLIEKGAQTPIVSIAITADDDNLTTTLMTIDPIDENNVDEIKKIANKYVKHYNLDRQINIHVIQYDNELSMLKDYLKLTKRAVCITGWNFLGYDMPYIKNRLKLYGLDMSSASIKNTVDWRGNPTHTFFVDYMDLFKENKWLIQNCENFKLDYVAEHLVGLGKLPFPIDPTDPSGQRTMTLKQLRELDISTFLAYNVIDTVLVQLIHRAINSIASVYHLASLSFTTLNECQSPVAHSTGILAKYFIDSYDNIVVAEAEQPKQRKYPGAFVKDPVRNYATALACFDYSSLYPSLIKTHNLSPANFIKKLDPRVDDIAKYMGNDEFTVTSTGSLYKNDKPYFYKVVEAELYDLRKSWDRTSTEMIQKCILPIDAELNRRNVTKDKRL